LTRRGRILVLFQPLGHIEKTKNHGARKNYAGTLRTWIVLAQTCYLGNGSRARGPARATGFEQFSVHDLTDDHDQGLSSIKTFKDVVLDQGLSWIKTFKTLVSDHCQGLSKGSLSFCEPAIDAETPRD